jgi:ribonuclease H2 subunit A
MLKPNGVYNLNAQAMDATIDLIKAVFAKGVNVKEIYIDTIGRPETYQKKLERIFPTAQITVAKKADSLYPCVSAASVCAKVTRDAALEVAYESYSDEPSAEGWGSGYPSDTRSSNWLKQNMDPVFGWGSECRFSWGTAKELLEMKNSQLRVDWPEDDDEDNGMKMTDFFVAASNETEEQGDELANWYGRRVPETAF